MITLGLIVAADHELVASAVPPTADTVIDVLALARGAEPEPERRRWDRVIVVAGSVRELRAALPQIARLEGRGRTFELVIGGHPHPSLLHVPPRAVGLRVVTGSSRKTLDKPIAHTRFHVGFLGLAPLHHALAAFLQGELTRWGSPAAGLRVGIGCDVATLAWAGGDPAARRVTDAEVDEVRDTPRAVDVVARRPPAPSWSELAGAESGEVVRFAMRDDLHAAVMPVDTDVLTPIGFAYDSQPDVVRLVRAGTSEPQVVMRTAEGVDVASYREWAGLTERSVDALRSVRAVLDSPTAHRGPMEQAAFLAQAASAALPVVAPELARVTRRALGDDLADMLTTATADELADPLRREWHCLTIQRLAFARHRARARWGAIATDAGRPPAAAPVSVSVVLATRRPQLLARTVAQVARQDWPDVELVVGLHGTSRDDPRVAAIERSFDRPLTILEIPGETSLGDMLNTLAGAASGDVVAKMDDDDWYGDHHLTDLVHAMEFSKADLVGAGAEFLYLAALDLTVRRHRESGNRYINRVPGAAMMLARDTLRSLGGIRPISRAIDTALAQTVAEAGGSMYRTHGLSMVVHRAAAGHTWDPGVAYFLRGDIDQWTGFVPPPGISADADPPAVQVPASWFDQVAAVRHQRKGVSA